MGCATSRVWVRLPHTHTCAHTGLATTLAGDIGSAVAGSSIFKEWDPDRRVSRIEFAQTLRSMGLQPAEKQMQLMFRKIDPTASGFVDRQQLRRALEPWLEAKPIAPVALAPGLSYGNALNARNQGKRAIVGVVANARELRKQEQAQKDAREAHVTARAEAIHAATASPGGLARYRTRDLYASYAMREGVMPIGYRDSDGVPVRVPSLEAKAGAVRAERATAMRASASFEHYALSDTDAVANKEVRRAGCNPMQSGLCSLGCNPMQSALCSHVLQAAEPTCAGCHPMRAGVDGSAVE